MLPGNIGVGEGEHFQEKWNPVFRPEMRKNKDYEHFQEKYEAVFRQENALVAFDAHQHVPHVGAGLEHFRIGGETVFGTDHVSDLT